jgi:hypothetical protein
MWRLPRTYVPVMREHRTPAGVKGHNYELPAIGWRKVLDVCMVDAYGPRGGRRKDTPSSLYTAIAKIQAVVATREHHPALSGGGIRGHSSEIIPVWEYDDVGDIPDYGVLWSPYPQDGHEDHMMILWPVHDEVAGHQVTTWVAKPPQEIHPTLNRWPYRIDDVRLFV